MSHRKFRAPRHGSLAFLPRKRCKRSRGCIKSFPPDNQQEDCHLTAFIGYKAGCTHIMRQLNRPGSKAHGKEIVESVTIIETPPMVVVGMVGLVQTPTGKRAVTTLWANHMDDSFKRKFYKNWCRSHKRCFTKYEQLWAKAAAGEDPAEVKRRLENMKKYCEVIRVIAHSQIKVIRQLNQKKAHVMEIQINGGTVEEKIKFGYDLFEKKVSVHDVFHQNESIDTIGITKGKGYKGVVSRWGVTRLPRKTHRGLRKVACIGSWHPARVQWTIPRAGQKGYTHRVEIHKKIYKLGKAITYDEDGKPLNFEASTEYDLTKKNITPMGGFVNYGIVKQDFIMIKGTCQGVRKRVVTLRKAICPLSSSMGREEIQLRFIDTSSKQGHGRFQTSAEKKAYYGPTKKDRLREAEAKAKKRAERKAAGEDVESDDDDDDEDYADRFLSENQKKKKRRGSKKKGSGKKGKGAKEKTKRKE